jgi:ParB family chromosome partitioning protein
MKASAVLKNVDISLVEISGANPRKDVKGESFKELKASIAEHGILEPLVVRPKGAKYELVAGERRLTAAKELKLETVPVTIRQLDDHTARVIMLLENLQREDLQPLEEAAALQELLIPYDTPIGTPHMTQEELAKKLGKSQPWIANRLRLLKAPEKLKEYLISGQMTPQHLIVLLPYCDKEAFTAQVLRKFDEKKGYRGSVTVEDLRKVVQDVLLDDSGKYALKPDKKDMGWHMEQLAKDMDLDECKGCEKTTMIEVEDDYDHVHKKAIKHKYRICLESECFRPRVAGARKDIKDRQELKVERAIKSGAIKTRELKHGVDYKTWDYAHIPSAWCKGCPKLQKAVDDQRVLDGAREKICLKPRCLEEREAYYRHETKDLLKRVRAAQAVSEKIFMKERQAGLNKQQLQLIIGALVSDRYDGTPRMKTDNLNEKQLEENLLKTAIQRESRDLECGDDVEQKVLGFVQRLPFKVEGDFSIKPPPPPELEQPEPLKEKKAPALVDAKKVPKKQTIDAGPRRYTRIILVASEKCGGCSKDLSAGAKAFKETLPPHEVLCSVCGRKENERLRSTDPPCKKKVQEKRKKKGAGS